MLRKRRREASSHVRRAAHPKSGDRLWSWLCLQLVCEPRQAVRVTEEVGLGGALLGESEKKEHSKPRTNEVIVGVGQAKCAIFMRSRLF